MGQGKASGAERSHANMKKQVDCDFEKGKKNGNLQHRQLWWRVEVGNKGVIYKGALK